MNNESDDEEIGSYPTDNAEELLAFCEQKLLDNPHNSIALILKAFALLSVKGSKEAYNFYMLLLQNDPDIERGVWGPYFYALRAVLEHSLEEIVEAPQSREDQLSEEFENKQNPIDIMKEDDLSGGTRPC